MARCDEFDSVSAWHDGELPPVEAGRVEAHLASCAVCRRTADFLAQTRQSLRRSARADVPARAVQRTKSLDGPARPRRRLALAALLAAASFGVGAALLLSRGGLAQAMAEELVSHHLRGFAREKPCELDSSDPAVIARWLEQRLGYAVEVPSMPGAKLLGARLCQLEGDRTAALMYMQDDKPVTVFVPRPGSSAAVAAESLSRGEVRCARGPLRHRICAKTVRQRMLAVAETSETTLAAALGAP